MELRQLRYFIAVAAELNFRKAAQGLNVTQPALSRQIRQLEELGTDLFVRNRKMVNLTQNGRLLLPQARNLIGSAKRMRELMSRVGGGQVGSVYVGVATALSENVRRIIVEYTRRFPKVDVQCKDMFSTFQNEALHRREIDVAFMRLPVDPRHLVSEMLFEESFMAILPRRSPLAKRKKVKLKEIGDQPLLLPKRAQSIQAYDEVLEMYRRAGIEPKIVHTATLPEASGGMLVESGKGIYIIPGSKLSHPDFGRGTVAVPLDEPSASIEVHVAWRKEETSAPVLNFLKTTRAVFGLTPN